jgi:cytochrome b pre-mRNA-processing protein 3
LSNLLVVEGTPNIFLISFLFVLFTINFSCFFSKKGTPWCLTTGLNEQFESIKNKKNIYNLFMSNKYIYIYNNLINFTRNKELYKDLNREDNFSDRLTLFLLHFSFFLKNYKNEDNKKVLQEIYDFSFRQLELSIREIGYGDQSINKKMKDYINLFHSMVSEIHFWDNLSKTDKIKKLSIFLEDFNNIDDLLEYFDEFNLNLSKKTLNYYLKSVSNP